jgi:hypothetical protein
VVVLGGDMGTLWYGPVVGGGDCTGVLLMQGEDTVLVYAPCRTQSWIWKV